MHHNIWRGVMVTVVWMALAVAQPAHARDQGVLRVGYTEPETLDPHLAISGYAQGMVRFLYRGLTRFAIRDGRVTTSEVDPDLAESWTEPDVGDLTWEFRLRPKIQFHKGFGEMTAEDVKFSFERQINNPKHMSYAHHLDVIDSIEVVNDHTVRITLTRPDPVFPLRMAGYQQGYIVSKTAVQQYDNQFQWNPVGTGPFYFEKRIKDEKIVLKAHRAYVEPQAGDNESPARLPTIREVHWFDVQDDATKLLGLKYGAFDIIHPRGITKDLITNVKLIGAVFDKRGPGTQWNLFLNTSHHPFHDIEVRRAVMSAIDRVAIKEAIWLDVLSTLATSPLPPGYVGHTPVEMPPYDPEPAKVLASRADPDPISLPAHYISEDFPYASIMALVKTQLEAVGIKLPLVTVKHREYHERIRLNQNAMVLYNTMGIMHTDVLLSSFYHASQAPNPRLGITGTNFSHYRIFDNVLAKMRQSTDDDDRKNFFHYAQRRLMSDAVVLPIAVAPVISVRHPKRVRSPFKPEFGEDALHDFYNYPERFELSK